MPTWMEGKEVAWERDWVNCVRRKIYVTLNATLDHLARIARVRARVSTERRVTTLEEIVRVLRVLKGKGEFRSFKVAIRSKTSFRCENLCQSGRYGLNCQGTCRCQNNATCSHTDGSCHCTAGWRGELCMWPAVCKQYVWPKLSIILHMPK